MNGISVTRTINAPVELVFSTISDINNFSKAVPDIVEAEIISDIKTGVGTRFREIRMISGRREITELEITEFVENNRIRITTDNHGAIWDSVFTVTTSDGCTNLQLSMEAKAYKMLPRLLNPVIKRFIKKALEKDMDAVKIYCES